MPDSLEDLLRRREILRERLEALDREIADAGGDPGSGPPYLGAGSPERGVAERILAEYRQDGAQDASKARRGCLLAFLAAIALLFVGLGAMYLYLQGRRGH